MKTPKYRRVLLKISGEFLAGNRDFGLDPERLNFVCNEIKSIREMGVEVAIVVGGVICGEEKKQPKSSLWRELRLIKLAC
jgi:uridylate kinase